MDWLPKIRNLNSIWELIEHCKLICISGGRQFNNKNGYFQAVEHVESNLLSVTVSKLASVVEKT